MKALLLGDTHAVIHSLEDAFKVAAELECESILQLGDYGFWPKDPIISEQYLMQVPDLVSRYEVMLHWLPGNHEDYEAVNFLENARRHWGEFVSDSFGAYYTGRVNSWSSNDLTFAVAGGAYSVDRKYRTENVSWFADEVLTDADADKLIENTDKIDILFAHDAPIDLSTIINKGMQWNLDASDESRVVLKRIVDHFKPKYLVHGHWHCQTTYTVDETICYGLNMAGNVGSVAIVEDGNIKRVS